MATKSKKTKAQTPAPEPEYSCGMDKIRDEMAKSKDGQIQLLGEGLTAMLQRHPEWEEHILRAGKTLTGALGLVRINAVRGCSDPIQTTKSLCAYYGIPCDDPHRLALEVSSAMLGGTEAADAERETTEDTPKAQTPAPDPFDLDALLGGL